MDLAKDVFRGHGASKTGHVKFRRKLTRLQFRKFMAELPPAVAVFQACGSASHWAREVESMAHEAKLIAPQYVRPFVKRQSEHRPCASGFWGPQPAGFRQRAAGGQERSHERGDGNLCGCPSLAELGVPGLEARVQRIATTTGRQRASRNGLRPPRMADLPFHWP
ncbi:transposase [Mangrovicoccus ximenensis]|uniref:transposase n=1 Tax=Mangrovicoccus ximenensis TaxID=1911570 RepID=UPI00191BEFB4|nr:transposase [Mangrovicoccus ximenensis]